MTRTDMPKHTDILWPMFALAAWTGCILLLIAARRIRAGRVSRISPKEYALGDSDRVPVGAVLANRNFMNLLELPLLFYIGCLTAFVIGAESSRLLVLAWLYVLFRLVHSLIHVTYNRVPHRFAAFAASNAVLVALWVALANALLRAGAGP